MTLTVKQACGHDWTGPTPTTAEETAAAVNTWRAKACDNDDCRPYAMEFAVARNRTDEEQRLRKRRPVHVLTGIGRYGTPAKPGSRFYHRHNDDGCTIVQLDDDGYRGQMAALNHQGFSALVRTPREHLKARLRSGEPTVTTLAMASAWIAGVMRVSPTPANDDAPAHVKEDAWPPAVRAAAYAAYTAWPPAARAVGYRA